MKKISVILAAVVAFCCIGALTQNTTAFAANYYLSDGFGAAPNARVLSEELERVELSSVHKPYTKYGFGVRLKNTSVGREYITYNVKNVNKVEVSAIAVQSVFAANHGWGLSLGVTDNALEVPFNNINNIDLESCYPIYLDKLGRPFIQHYLNGWMCYIAGGGKFSFAPSTLDVKNMLRPFTVPSEVMGEVDEGTNQIIKAGMLYPMVNVEYGVKSGQDVVWTPLSMSEKNFKIKSAEFLGGDKEYNQTVEISNIPQADMIRIGMNYIRETLKPSAEGDTEADVFEPFAKSYDESLYVTNVKLTMTEPYDGGFEELNQEGIDVDYKLAKRTYAMGEDFTDSGLVLLDVFENGVKDISDKTFTVDSSAFNKYKSGVYSIRLVSGEDSCSYYVEVIKPDSLSLDLTGAKLTYGKNETFTSDGIKVTAVTKIVEDTKQISLPSEVVTYDFSKVDFKKKGTYNVIVSVGKASDKVTAEYEIVVEKSATGCGIMAFDASPLTGIFILSAMVLLLFTAKKAKKVVNEKAVD